MYIMRGLFVEKKYKAYVCDCLVAVHASPSPKSQTNVIEKKLTHKLHN